MYKNNNNIHTAKSKAAAAMVRFLKENNKKPIMETPPYKVFSEKRTEIIKEYKTIEVVREYKTIEIIKESRTEFKKEHKRIR